MKDKLLTSSEGLILMDNLKPEHLDEELKECITKLGKLRWIHHPLMMSLAPLQDPSLECAYLNRGLKQQRERYEKLLLNNEFSLAIFTCVTRPYRTDAFDLYSDEMDDKTYWSLLAEVWIDQENHEDFTDEWRRRFSVKRPHKEHLMEPVERGALKKLRDPIVLYRAGLGDEALGLSWTTQLKVAKWFGRRFGANHKLYTATVRKEHVVAYWTRRKENEILILDTSVLENVQLYWEA